MALLPALVFQASVSITSFNFTLLTPRVTQVR